MFLNFINYFRGFAILLIVMGHLFEITKVFNYSNFQDNPFLTKIIFSLIGGGTALFVFISGFLFHHVFYSRGFNFKKFMNNKFKNVFLPYLFMITPVIIYQIFLNGKYSELYNSNLGLLKILALNYYSGTLLFSTWYIPFAFLLFITSPLFIKFIELKKYHKRIIAILLIAAGIVHRPAHDLTVNIFQALIYFSPTYCLGIYLSMKKESFFNYFSNKEYLFGGLTLAILALQLHMGNFGSPHKSILKFTYFDLMIFQKFFMCLFLVLFFNRIENKLGSRLKNAFDVLADYSFPIFFIHNYIIQFFYPAIGLDRNTGYLGLFILTITTLILSIFFAYSVKTAFKKKSRMIIGG